MTYLVVEPLFVVALELVCELDLLPQHGAQAVVHGVALELGQLQKWSSKS